MLRSRRLAALASVAALGVLTACGQQGAGQGVGSNYPGRPVTLTAPAEPGSGWDTTARALAEVIQEENLTKTALPVQNRAGATGSVWLSRMINEYRGDPYQIAVTSLPIMSNKLRGDSEYGYQDVTMIARIITEYYLVVVPADSPYKTLDDLLAAIEKNPKSVPVGAAGDDRLPFALVVKEGKGDPRTINFVAYEGGGEQITALLNGDVQAAVAGVSEFRGQIEAGKLRGLAVLRDERLTAPLDDIPTAKELGYDVALGNWRGIYGPPGMPKEAVTYWQDTLQKTLRTDSWKRAAAQNQWETTYMEGAELTAYLDKTYEEIREGMQSVGGSG
ncbi:MAG: tripartite tricarboxylate transporter substrate binding protein [Streptosporangiales bacterium]|nr:tripartite tricarboxylate transporter substrate binding protein [Streptosporangiales bacterium]